MTGLDREYLSIGEGEIHAYTWDLSLKDSGGMFFFLLQWFDKSLKLHSFSHFLCVISNLHNTTLYYFMR